MNLVSKHLQCNEDIQGHPPLTDLLQVKVTTKTDFVSVLANQHQENLVYLLNCRWPRLKSFHCICQKAVRKHVLLYFVYFMLNDS